MNYRPQELAASLDHWTELLLHLNRQVAALAGKVDSLQYAKADTQENDPAFDRLAAAIHAAFGSSTWTSSDVIGRTLGQSVDALDLLCSLEGIGKTTARTLGIYLSSRVPGPNRVTAEGLEVKRNGEDARTLCWSIARV